MTRDGFDPAPLQPRTRWKQLKDEYAAFLGRHHLDVPARRPRSWPRPRSRSAGWSRTTAPASRSGLRVTVTARDKMRPPRRRSRRPRTRPGRYEIRGLRKAGRYQRVVSPGTSTAACSVGRFRPATRPGTSRSSSTSTLTKGIVLTGRSLDDGTGEADRGLRLRRRPVRQRVRQEARSSTRPTATTTPTRRRTACTARSSRRARCSSWPGRRRQGAEGRPAVRRPADRPGLPAVLRQGRRPGSARRGARRPSFRGSAARC